MPKTYSHSVLLIALLCILGGISHLSAATTSPDLKWAEAQGPVMTIIEDSLTLEFNRDGRMKSISIYGSTDIAPEELGVRRNSAEQIVGISRWVSFGEEDEPWKVEDEYTYDASGYVVDVTLREADYEEFIQFVNDGARGRHMAAISYDAVVTEYSFTYPEVDAFGNWTKRHTDILVFNSYRDYCSYYNLNYTYDDYSKYDSFRDYNDIMSAEITPPERRQFYTKRTILYWEDPK